jgi:hypothetical protein
MTPGEATAILKEASALTRAALEKQLHIDALRNLVALARRDARAGALALLTQQLEAAETELKVALRAMDVWLARVPSNFAEAAA